MKLNGGLRIALFALMAGGCATATQLEDQARVHTYRADAAAQRGDYDHAAEEKHEANRLHEKAVKRAYKHGESAGVEVPATVPQSPSGY